MTNLKKPLLLSVCCLAVGAGGQLALQAHLDRGMTGVYPNLVRPLQEFPMQWTFSHTAEHTSVPVSQRAWFGKDQPESATLSAKITFADELIARWYVLEDTRLVTRLYAIYSRTGEDREHHPEICIRDVAGAPEDKSASALIPLDSDQKRLVQRYRFKTGTNQHTYVYYWHYTLEPEVQVGQSYLQALHQRIGRRAPSVTIQVSTAAPPKDAPLVEHSFLAAVDQAMQQRHLPATARIGCDRLPIRFTGPE